jgi:hypothetical protein
MQSARCDYVLNFHFQFLAWGKKIGEFVKRKVFLFQKTVTIIFWSVGRVNGILNVYLKSFS